MNILLIIICRSSGCRSSGLSVKWRVGQVAVGQVVVGQVAVGQVSATPPNDTLLIGEEKDQFFVETDVNSLENNSFVTKSNDNAFDTQLDNEENERILNENVFNSLDIKSDDKEYETTVEEREETINSFRELVEKMCSKQIESNSRSKQR